jgi:hypothetical protein
MQNVFNIVKNPKNFSHQSVNLNNELSSPTAQMGLKLCRYNEVI